MAIRDYWKWYVFWGAFLLIEFALGLTLSAENWLANSRHHLLPFFTVAFGFVITGHLAFGWFKRFTPLTRWVLVGLGVLFAIAMALP